MHLDHQVLTPQARPAPATSALPALCRPAGAFFKYAGETSWPVCPARPDAPYRTAPRADRTLSAVWCSTSCKAPSTGRTVGSATHGQASAHFGVGKDGRIYQWADAADRVWAQAAGNRTWLSIEHEGHAGEELTEKLLAATARIVAWAHTEHGVPLRLADSPEGRGIGWHGTSGSAWGGHTGCPGTPIKNQRAAIIKTAGGRRPPASHCMSRSPASASSS
ncbi:N-acetylmuramoyl-L-alanine amidase [Streptomyces sp. NPDC021225]|uniref:N-acetylmuramoyl-L-alanine amidase n=1 Tax=Streptomyces sp. NPDC021225 TaxID=3365121 RepID=UPI0037B38B23